MASDRLPYSSEKTVGLLDAGDEQVKRLTDSDIIHYFLKRREQVDIEEHIQRLEERLAER